MRQKKVLTVVANRKCRTNFHRRLGGGGFRVTFWLLEKIDSRFVVVRFQKVRCRFETSATHRARRVDVPPSGNIQRLFAVFVRHDAFVLNEAAMRNLFAKNGQRFGVAVGIALGSTSGSIGKIIS